MCMNLSSPTKILKFQNHLISTEKNVLQLAYKGKAFWW